MELRKPRERYEPVNERIKVAEHIMGKLLVNASVDNHTWAQIDIARNLLTDCLKLLHDIDE